MAEDMATSLPVHGSTRNRGGHFLEQMEDLLKCAICTDVVRCPKILPCMHTFCLDCLNKYKRQVTAEKTKMACPVCRSPLSISKMTSLPDNLLAGQFLEHWKRMKSNAKDFEDNAEKRKCENCCGEDQLKSEAMKYCQECGQKLCMKCVEAHKLLKITSKHSLMDLKTKAEGGSHVCAIHPSSKASMYCEECLSLLCPECGEDRHAFHSKIDLEELVTQLHIEATKAGLRAEHLEKMEKLSEKEKSVFMQCTGRIEESIRREANRLRAMVNDGEANLLTQLDSLKQGMMKEGIQFKNQVELLVLVLRSCEDNLSRLASELSDADAISSIITKREAVCKETTDILNVRHLRPRYTSIDFKQLLTNEIEASRNIVGTIKSSQKDEAGDNLSESRAEQRTGTYGCAHYKRHCTLKAACCAHFYPCRFCHDENEDHKMDRTKVKDVRCIVCAKTQPVAKWCINCDTEFGQYFCAICRMYDDTDKGQFHCDKCDICRVGGRHNFWHCDKCGICISVGLRESHVCAYGAGKLRCQVCYEGIFESTTALTVLECGHILHKMCFIERPNPRGACSVCYNAEKEQDVEEEEGEEEDVVVVEEEEEEEEEKREIWRRLRKEDEKEEGRRLWKWWGMKEEE